jgi:hypothetical protein
MEHAVHTHEAKSDSLGERDLAAIILPILGLAVGVISYGEVWWTIGISIILPVLLFRSESRLTAFLVAFSYQMGASRSLAMGAGKFYGDDLFFGVIIWAAGNALTALVYAGLWHRKRKVRLLFVPVAMVLTALPPLGILGWASPFTAAGIIFPGAGLAGFFYLIGLYAALSARASGAIKLFLILSLYFQMTAKTHEGSGIEGISTSFHRTEDLGSGDYGRQMKLIGLAEKSKSKTILFPENMVSGGWTSVPEKLWRKASRQKTIIVGATLFKTGDDDGKLNVLAILEKGRASYYIQRQPIPFSMWRPLSRNGYEANWFKNPTVNAGGKPTAFLICYEGFLVWPIVHSYLAGAERITAAGNYWWTNGRDIPTIQHSIIRSWSRLFGLPYSVAVNT